MLDVLALWLIAVVFFLLGYILGNNAKDEED